jgi:hypothetical protein
MRVRALARRRNKWVVLSGKKACSYIDGVWSQLVAKSQQTLAYASFRSLGGHDDVEVVISVGCATFKLELNLRVRVSLDNIVHIFGTDFTNHSLPKPSIRHPTPNTVVATRRNPASRFSSPANRVSVDKHGMLLRTCRYPINTISCCRRRKVLCWSRYQNQHPGR